MAEPTVARCVNCGEVIVQEKDDPWFHNATGEERCERNGVLTDDFAVPAP